MDGLTEPPNCSVRYANNQTNIQPISVFERHAQCEIPQLFTPHYLVFYRILIILWIMIGILGNSISFVIWISKQQRRRNSSAIYLAALAMTDLILIVLLVFNALEHYWCIRTVTLIPGICQIFQCLFIFAQYYSIILVFGFTLERYIAVCFPFKRHKLCTNERAVIAISILALFVLGPMIFQAIIWTFENGECVMRANLAMDERIQTVFYVQEVLFSLVVPLATLVFNVLVLCEMRRLVQSNNLLKVGQPNTSDSKPHHSCWNCFRSPKYGKNSDDYMGKPNSFRAASKTTESSQFVAATFMLIILSFYLIACTVPTGIMFLVQFRWIQPDDCLTDEMIRQNYEWQHFFNNIGIKLVVDAICASHYACNFFIYLATGSGFRKQVWNLILCKFKTARRLSDLNTETLILSRRTAPRPLHPYSPFTVGSQDLYQPNYKLQLNNDNQSFDSF